MAMASAEKHFLWARKALALFLLLVRPDDLPGQDLTAPRFEILFKDGSMEVAVGIADGLATYTEFLTPVHGARN